MKSGLIHSSMIPLQGGINFRDQGGYTVKDGRKVKPGLLFRSGALDELTEQDCHYLNDNNVVHILDYRDSKEVEHKPDVIWQSAEYYHIPANPVLTETSADLEKFVVGSLDKINPHRLMTELYSLLPFNNPAYRQLIKLMQQTDEQGIVQHCAVGKDRTGVGSAITLLVLGADKDTVIEDYLITETTLEPYRKKFKAKLADQLSSEGLKNFDYIFSAKEEFITKALNSIDERYQTVDNWLQQEFALTQEKREVIQEKYLTR